MNIITKQDIRNFGSYSDRSSSFDDKKEILVASNFLRKKCNNSDIIKEKPFGKYGVDLGVFNSENELKFIVDVERWSKWKNDWPCNYKYISFLQRKEKFLNDIPFAMMFFNFDLSKFVRIKKEDILKFPPTKRFTQGKYDFVRKIPFECGKMYGTGFGQLEKSIFEYEVCKL